MLRGAAKHYVWSRDTQSNVMIPDPWCRHKISAVAIFQVNEIAHKESYYISFLTLLVERM